MLTRSDELHAAVQRLEKFRIPTPAAQAFVAQVLGHAGWEEALGIVESGGARYPDTWIIDAQARFETAVRSFERPQPRSDIPSVLSQASLLDIFQIMPPAELISEPGLPQDEVIRRMVKIAAPNQLIPHEAVVLKGPGQARSTIKATPDYFFKAQSVRIAHEGTGHFRIDSWWVNAEDQDGPVAALAGHCYIPIGDRPVPGEKALLAADTVGRELLCDLLSVVGSLPRGQIKVPMANADYIYVAPRGRGNRLALRMFERATTELQRVTPRFGTFLIDPYILLDPVAFPVGTERPSNEVLQQYMDQHLLLPIANALSKRKCAMRLKARHLSLGEEQALHLIGEISAGKKLHEIQILPEADLISRRIRTPMVLHRRPEPGGAGM